VVTSSRIPPDRESGASSLAGVKSDRHPPGVLMTPPRCLRDPPRSRKLLPLVVALFLAGTIGRVLHFSTIEHRWCQQHQAFEHFGAAPDYSHETCASHAHGHAPGRTDPDDRGREGGAPADAPHDAHAPCDAPDGLRQGVVPWHAPPLLVQRASPTVWIARTAPAPLRAFAIARWPLAPKNSPPS